MARGAEDEHDPLGGANALAAPTGVELWRTAMRWRRETERELARVGLTLTHWLVLEATSGLIAQSGDATHQARVAARAQLDKMTVSQAMRRLERAGFVDQGPDLSSSAYRIWMTARGRRALTEGRERIEAASRAVLGSRHARLARALLDAALSTDGNS